jgi:hypothetical protein
MASRQHDGIPIICGRPECRRMLCRALPGRAGDDAAVVLVNLRQPARLTPAEAKPGPVRRVLLVCRGQVMIRGIRRRCEWQQTLRLDEGALVDLVRDPAGRRRLVLGVDV